MSTPRRPGGTRITSEQIEERIEEREFMLFGTLTVCVLTLANGFKVVGHSAPVSEENFNMLIGREVAEAKATDQIWMLEGYRLKQAWHEHAQGSIDEL